MCAQSIPGVPKIRPGLNPATWVLEVTTPAAEQRMGVDFADLYENSELYRYSAGLLRNTVRIGCMPLPGAARAHMA